MNREEALAMLDKYIKNERMKYHCLASEAVMRALARKLGRDEEKWGSTHLQNSISKKPCEEKHTNGR